MRILTIAGESLASLDRFEVHLAAGELAGAGLLVICGPTGAGKSTLLDALCLALYDRTPRLGGDSLAVVQKSAVTAMAQVDFRDSDGQSWRAIWRTRRAHRKLSGEWQPTQLELHNLDTGADHSSHRKKETLQLIEKKVGLGFDQFCRSVLLAQGDFARFLHETGKERARLLETITGGEIYSELSQLTFQHHKAARERLEQLADEAAQSRILSDEQRAELREQHGTARGNKVRLEQQRDGYQALVEHYREIAEREREVATAAAALTAAKAALEQAAPVVATLARGQRAERLRPLLLAADEASKAELDATAAVTAATWSGGETAARTALALQTERQRDGEREQARVAWQIAQPVLQRARGVEQERRAAAQAQATAQAALAAAKAALTERDQELAGHRGVAARADANRQQALSYLAAHPELQRVHGQQQSLQRDLAGLCQQQAALGELERRRLALHPELQKGGAALAAAQHEVTAANAARQLAQTRLDEEQEALRRLTASGAIGSTQHELSLLGRLRGRLDEGLRLLAARTEREERVAQLDQQLAADELVAQTQRTAEAGARGEQAQLTVTRGELDADLHIAQAAADLATRRPELLKPGKPCPLCGATEHPLAEPQVRQHGGEATLLARLGEELRRVDAALEVSRLREREAAAEARAAQARLTSTQEQRAELVQKLTQAATQRQALSEELKQLQNELAAAQSPLADELKLSGSAPELLDAQRSLAALVERLALRMVELERFLAAHTAQQATVATAQAGCDRERRRWEQLAQSATKLQQAQTTLEQQHLQLEEKRLATLALAEQARAAAVAQLGDYAPWHELLGRDPAALQEVLGAGLREFTAQLQAGETAAQALAAATAEVRIATVAVAHASAEHDTREAALAELARVLVELTARRTELLATLGSTDPELDLEQFATALQAASEGADAAHQAAIAARMTAEREAAVAAAALAQAARWQATAQDSHAARRAALTAALTEAGFVDRAEAAALLAVAASEWQQQQALVDACRRAEVEASSRLRDRAERLQLHRDRDLAPWLQAISDPAVSPEPAPPSSQSAAEQGRDQAKAELQTVLDSLYILQVRLEEDEQRQAEAVQRQAERAAQESLVADWAVLNELIGSADGAKFRAFAQSLTLETLLVYTNEHLRSLRPRYSLRRRSELVEGKNAEAAAAKADALFAAHEDLAQVKRRVAELLADGEELALKDLGDAGEDVDVARLQYRPLEVWSLDQGAAFGDVSHAQVALDQRQVLFGVVGDEQLVQPLVAHDRHRERLGNARHGHVVVRRSDAARGEHVIKARCDPPHRLGNRRYLVGDHGNLAQRHPQAAQLRGQKRRVGIDGLAREDFVANDDQGCGGHGRRIAESAPKAYRP